MKASTAAQAAGGQVAEERQPAGAVLAAGDVQAQDLAVPVAVHAGRDQGVHPDDAAAFANLQHNASAATNVNRPSRRRVRTARRGRQRALRS
jgi:hypothetical protein